MAEKILIAPSILAADWGRFQEEIAALAKAGADWIHVDVMDGHFVPPITFGPGVVAAAKRGTALPLDVHLMIENPENQLEDFARAGATRITVHQEACPHLHRIVQRIHELGLKAGVALNPATPVATLSQVVPFVDLVLIMTVNPGWGGQHYIAESTEKIAQAAALIKQHGGKAYLEVDGGITAETATQAVGAGANVLVAGTSILSSKDYAAAIKALRKG